MLNIAANCRRLLYPAKDRPVVELIARVDGKERINGYYRCDGQYDKVEKEQGVTKSRSLFVLALIAVFAVLYFGHGLHKSASAVEPPGQVDGRPGPPLPWQPLGSDPYGGTLNRLRLPNGWLVEMIFRN